MGEEGEEEEEEEEEMDVEEMLAETPSFGAKPLDCTYPYKCFKVNINDSKYDTKQDPPSGSWAPISPQCYCGVQCTDSGDLATHKSNVHPGDKNWRCSQCETVCQDKCAVWKHFRNFHLHIFIHKCSFGNCGSGFQQGVYGNDEQPPVWWHMDQVHKLPSPLGCPTCNKQFASPVSQKKHMEGKCGQLEPRKKKFACTARGCRKQYTEKKKLDIHLKTHEPGASIVKYVCATCGKDYGSSSALRKHEKSHAQ